MSSTKYTFGKRIKFYRESMGLKQCDLAKKADLTPAAICNMEKDIRKASMGSLIRLSKALDISIDELVGV